MIIIFLGNTGVYGALIAANIYLGKITNPNFNEIEWFGNTAKDQSGFPIYIKDDSAGNQIYTLGAYQDLHIVQKALEQLVTILDVTSKDIIIKPISCRGEKIVSLLIKTPKIPGKIWLINKISQYFMRQEFSSIINQVETLRTQLKT